jgi:hypothetical protein
VLQNDPAWIAAGGPQRSRLLAFSGH